MWALLFQKVPRMVLREVLLLPQVHEPLAKVGEITWMASIMPMAGGEEGLHRYSDT